MNFLDQYLPARSDCDFVRVAAPMVRYSKMPFRILARHYGCDLAFTPMIMANSFIKSDQARASEFSTCSIDRPLIVQFASNHPTELSTAAALVKPHSDGVDLNCGCPQSWAIHEQVGSYLLRRTDLSCELLKECKRTVGTHEATALNPRGFSVSCKIRLVPSAAGSCQLVNCSCLDKSTQTNICLRHTVDHCRQLQSTGIDWLTIHARFPWERREAAHWDAVKTLVELLHCPIILNGDVTSFESAKAAHLATSCQGIMVAEALLTNPALFQGHSITPLTCVKEFVDLSLQHGTSLLILHRHLNWMLESHLDRTQKRIFNSLGSVAAILDFLNDEFPILQETLM